MNFWDDPKFSRPTDAVGDWHVTLDACFEQEEGPTATKYAIESLTKQLLQREPLDIAAPVLRYCGTSGAGGHPCTVRLELSAIGGASHLYRLTNENSAPRRWEQEQRFTAACEHRFAHWCAQLRIVANVHAWPSAPRALLEQCVMEVVATEEAALRVVEDMAPVVALQRQVLDALRSGMGFFTAHKEGGSHLFFDGSAFRRSDYGDGPDRSAVYADDASMIEGLRRFYDWEARQDSYPHPKPELDVWQYIQGKLRPR
ncbi:MAG: hypothetical protein ABI671_16165 [Burkholderiales bacterium]